MCGIAGFVGPRNESLLRAMTDALQHRGPDADGAWIDSSAERAPVVHLGHRRLSIVDLEGGAQPMWTADSKIGVVFNGEIYNHDILRAELKGFGYEFVSDHSDTEVLLHAYRHWGDSFVERLNGMWAFVIFDRERQRLFASRDRFGKKPFYYFREAGVFAFASELHAVSAHPACPQALSMLALRKYFAYCFIPAPRTVLDHVWKLPGGHNLALDLRTQELKVWAWWKFVLEPDPRLLDPQAASDPRVLDSLCEELRALLDASVRRRLMSDVPLGIFLSGGIDSSAIAAFACRARPADSVQTFSIGFTDPSFDESSHAAEMARFLGTAHQCEMLDIETAPAVAREVLHRLDEPMGDASLVPTYLLSRFTRRHVTVALGGDGGDELFAGYDPFRALHASQKYAGFMPKPAHEAVRRLASRLPVSHANVSLDFKIKRTLRGLSYPPALWNSVWMGAIEPREAADLFGATVADEEVYSEAIEAWDSCTQRDVVDRSLQWWTNLYLQDGILAKVDRASMLCSLEARSPFLDKEIVDFARRLPHQFKLRGGCTKWILKRALEPVLPQSIVNRKKKGFGMPIGRWLREGQFPLDACATSQWLSPDFLDNRATGHRIGGSDERLLLWCQMVFAAWLNGRGAARQSQAKESL